MTIYRIARTKFCDDSGEGAKMYGGRWNFPGSAALYGSGSVSAGLLERLTIDPELFSAERYVLYSVMEIHCPGKFIVRPGIGKLPAGWDAIPFSKISQDFGTHILQDGALCFGVPSVVDKSSMNYVLNPMAKGFDKLVKKVYPLNLDFRIIK